MAVSEETPQAEESRYVLITQCLQNDLLLNPECRLSLPESVVREVLLGQRGFDTKAGEGVRHLPSKALEEGPLGLFLARTIGRRLEGEKARGVLHVINLRDWHVPDDNYDYERRRYGAHCEAGTWGAGYVDGFERWLDPAGSPLEEKARYFEEGSIRIHHVHADSIFDFRPRLEYIDAQKRKFGQSRKFGPSSLEILLDVIIQGSEAHQERARELLRADPHPQALLPLKNEIDKIHEGNEACSSAPLYVGVIGFYTDIKVAILLAGLRTRYELPNLAVSDTFTASTTLERHLSGLDFAAKLLNVEVIHGINDLVRFLGGTEDAELEESKIVAADSFSRYQTYFQDRQNVLAYDSEKLKEYERLTQRRSIGVYETIRRANTFLIAWGTASLTVTLILAILQAFGVVDETAPTAILAGLTLAAFVGVFFTRPSSDLQRNLTNLAIFKMILESHSLKTALARFHLTTPQALRELPTEPEAVAAKRQIETLQEELKAVEDVDRADFEGLRMLGFSTEPATAGSAGESTPAEESVPVEESVPAEPA
jgi:hypothetical protein